LFRVVKRYTIPKQRIILKYIHEINSKTKRLKLRQPVEEMRIMNQDRLF